MLFKPLHDWQSLEGPTRLFLLLIASAFTLAVHARPTSAEEVVSQYFREGKRVVRARSYGEYEVLSRYNNLPFSEKETPAINLDFRGPATGKVRKSTFQADAHWGFKVTVKIPPVGSLAGLTVFDPLTRAAELGRTSLPASILSGSPPSVPKNLLWTFPQPMRGSDYESRPCLDCHPQKAHNIHSARIGNACRQCHGEEPIAGINHYYSRMNPIRRHSYVCAKCHEGSSASFATFLVHEPSPFAVETLRTFPLLFYAVWFMTIVAIGTFVVFLPLAFLWGLREFFPHHSSWRLKASTAPVDKWRNSK